MSDILTTEEIDNLLEIVEGNEASLNQKIKNILSRNISDTLEGLTGLDTWRTPYITPSKKDLEKMLLSKKMSAEKSDFHIYFSPELFLFISESMLGANDKNSKDFAKKYMRKLKNENFDELIEKNEVRECFDAFSEIIECIITPYFRELKRNNISYSSYVESSNDLNYKLFKTGILLNEYVSSICCRVSNESVSGIILIVYSGIFTETETESEFLTKRIEKLIKENKLLSDTVFNLTELLKLKE